MATGTSHLISAINIASHVYSMHVLLANDVNCVSKDRITNDSQSS